jgi:hypothetical protein
MVLAKMPPNTPGTQFALQTEKQYANHLKKQDANPAEMPADTSTGDLTGPRLRSATRSSSPQSASRPALTSRRLY